MFNIYDGRDSFFQWDLNQKLIVNDASIDEVHFCNKTDDCALVCEVYEQDGKRLVNVPNILLQDNWDIRVYGYCGGCYTKIAARFKVNARSKPTDYVYTETEIKSWEALEQKIDDKLNNAVGTRTAANGIIFNSENNKALSKHSSALGDKNIAGGYCYKILSIWSDKLHNDVNDRIYLDSCKGLEVGMEFSIVCQTAYYCKGTISSINTTDKYIETTENISVVKLNKAEDNLKQYEVYNALIITGRPELGTTPYGFMAQTIGVNNIAHSLAAYAEGNNNIALGSYSHAEGNNNKVGYNSHSEGSYNIALAASCHTEGTKNTIKTLANYSHAEGENNEIAGSSSHAEGKNNILSGSYAHAEGQSNKVYGFSNHAEGLSNTVNGTASHAQGQANNIYASCAMAAGKENKIYSKYGTVFGFQNEIGKETDEDCAEGAFCSGKWNYLYGNYSAAFGTSATVNSAATNAFVAGQGVKATAKNQAVVGQYNNPVDSYLFTVGNGKSSSARANAFAVKNDGSLVLKGTAGDKVFTPAMIDALYNMLSA